MLIEPLRRCLPSSKSLPEHRRRRHNNYVKRNLLVKDLQCQALVAVLLLFRCHAASPTRANKLQTQLQSIYETLPKTDLKQLLMVYITSPELVGTDLLDAIREYFNSQQDLFTDFACKRFTLRILRDLLRSSGVNVDCRQGVKIATGVTKALYGEQASVSVDDETLV
jgi:hypothetical protein